MAIYMRVNWFYLPLDRAILQFAAKSRNQSVFALINLHKNRLQLAKQLKEHHNKQCEWILPLAKLMNNMIALIHVRINFAYCIINGITRLLFNSLPFNKISFKENLFPFCKWSSYIVWIVIGLNKRRFMALSNSKALIWFIDGTLQKEYKLLFEILNLDQSYSIIGVERSDFVLQNVMFDVIV